MSKAQADALKAQVAKMVIRTLKPGDTYDLPGNRKLTVTAEEVGEDEELGSDEEYEIVEEDEDDVVQSGTVVSAPAESLARRKEVAELGEETNLKNC